MMRSRHMEKQRLLCNPSVLGENMEERVSSDGHKLILEERNRREENRSIRSHPY